jgi:hypothetical protein
MFEWETIRAFLSGERTCLLGHLVLSCLVRIKDETLSLTQESTMMMFAKGFQNGWKPTSKTGENLLNTQLRSQLIKLMISFTFYDSCSHKIKVLQSSTTTWKSQQSSLPPWPSLVPTHTHSYFQQRQVPFSVRNLETVLSRNYRLELYLVVLLIVPTSLTLSFQKTRNAS